MKIKKIAIQNISKLYYFIVGERGGRGGRQKVERIDKDQREEGEEKREGREKIFQNNKSVIYENKNCF